MDELVAAGKVDAKWKKQSYKGMVTDSVVVFVVRDGNLVFERELAQERLGVGRWTSMVFGIAGSYGKDDAVDVVYERDGRPAVAAKLRFEQLD